MPAVTDEMLAQNPSLAVHAAAFALQDGCSALRETEQILKHEFVTSGDALFGGGRCLLWVTLFKCLVHIKWVGESAALALSGFVKGRARMTTLLAVFHVMCKDNLEDVASVHKVLFHTVCLV